MKTGQQIATTLPKLPHDSVPVGKDEEDNGSPSLERSHVQFALNQKPHWEIAENLGIFDFERGGKSIR